MSKKGNKVFEYIIVVLFISFIAVYMSNKYGYLEYINRRQVVLTHEQIEKFEQDIKNGKDITLENYAYTKKDYQNKLSKAGLGVSKGVAAIIKRGVEGFFSGIDKIITEK